MKNLIHKIDHTLIKLFQDAKYDRVKMLQSIPKGILRPLTAHDYKDIYLSISAQQGEGLVKLIVDHELKNIVEFGTSFGISTLYLAQGIVQTGGHIITTELLPNKAAKALENFKKAAVDHLIELRIGDAIKTLEGHQKDIDLLFLDGWKDLYLPLFQMLEPNFHSKTYIYVDNADMEDVKTFLSLIEQHSKYIFSPMHEGKTMLISLA